MVDIYVGQENTKWILHEKLLCHRSKFFRNIFYSKENKNRSQNSYGLPEEEDAPFRLFVGWLYSGVSFGSLMRPPSCTDECSTHPLLNQRRT
jgi:hypothetical protein